jgi:hypothetical protein
MPDRLGQSFGEIHGTGRHFARRKSEFYAALDRETAPNTAPEARVRFAKHQGAPKDGTRLFFPCAAASARNRISRSSSRFRIVSVAILLLPRLVDR